jgi:hypothetical protein
MKKAAIWACLAASALWTAPSIAATSNITSTHRADYYAAGKHQFYAWCAGGQDRIVRQDGASASDAGAKLAQKTAGCRLSWQGRIAS